MATALGSPLVWATYAVLDSKPPKNYNILPPAKSMKIYLGNGLEGNQCLLESPPITRSNERMSLADLKKFSPQGWRCPGEMIQSRVVSYPVRLLQEPAAAEEGAPYLRPLSPPSPDANQAFCLHNAPSQGQSQLSHGRSGGMIPRPATCPLHRCKRDYRPYLLSTALYYRLAIDIQQFLCIKEGRQNYLSLQIAIVFLSFGQLENETFPLKAKPEMLDTFLISTGFDKTCAFSHIATLSGPRKDHIWNVVLFFLENINFGDINPFHKQTEQNI